MTRARDPLLTTSAVLGVLVVAALAVLGASHARPVAFRSGSMVPAIPTGSVAVVHLVPAADLEVGDVVTVPVQGTFVTHRIVQLTRSGTAATLQLKGDANRTPDAQLHQLASAERVVFSVPWLGYLLAALTGPAGLFLGATYVVWLLRRALVGAPSSRRRPTHRAPLPVRRHRRRVAVGAVTVVVVGATTVAAAPRVWAAPWTDPVPVAGSSLTAATVPAPTLSCSAGLASVTFSWTAVPGATGYTLTAGGATYTVTGTSQVVVALVNGGNATVVARRAFGSPVTTTWTSAASNSWRYTMGVTPSCG